MKRRRIISVSVLLALLSAAAPVSLASYIAWRNAQAHEREKLEHLADLTIRRAEGAFAEADGALRRLDGTRLPACSPVHIARMRALVLASHYLHELGYFEREHLRCTSWGPVERNDIGRAPPDYVTGDQLAVTTHLHPLANPGQAMIGLQRGAYNALINPAALTDLIVAPGIGLAIASDSGQLLASTTPLAARMLGLPAAAQRDDSTSGQAWRPGWHAVATQPAIAIQQTLRSEQARWLPLGVLVSLLLVGLVIWASRKRLSPLARLQLAVQRHEFVVHYQPIVALDDGRCVGAEALVRWRRPDGSLTPPDQFIPLAERSGLIQPITDQVLARVVAEMAALLRATPTMHIAINVYAEDIRSGRIQALLATQLRGSGIAPGQIWIEATERSFMDIDAARGTIIQLRELGHPVAIDDFGTGYSSLQYLQGLPLDALKIDRSFVETIGMDSVTSSVTAHIIDMARELGLRTVAEGIERQEQLDYLRAHGVDCGQGWLFSKALPAEELIAYQQRIQPRRRSVAAPG